MLNDEMFEPYDRLLRINILGTDYEVPENNSILRCLQFLEIEKISDAELCWNGDCLNCQVWLKSDEGEKAVIACRTTIKAGTTIVRLSDAIAVF
ncbi:hypothetical protein BH24ACI3_BH24ACI3_04490 [soil metagenome]